MLRANALMTLILACCLLEAAGQTTFNRRYDPTSPGQGQSSWSVEQMANGDIVVIANCGYTDPDLNWYYSSVITALRLNADGDVVGEHFLNIPYKANYPGWANSSAKCTDGTVVVGGNTLDSSQARRATLFRFSESGSPIGFWEYGGPTGAWIGRQAKQTPDGGFVICGETNANGSGLEAFVLKTDAQGEQEWVQTYGGGNNDYFNAVDMRPGQGYYLGGQFATTVTNQDLWVRSVNNSGGLIWNKVWGGPYREPNAHLTAAAEGHALIASAWGQTSSTLRLYMAKLHQADGGIIWDRTYGSAMSNTTLFVVQEIEPGGDLIATGQVTDGFDPKGVLLRTTSAGDSLWMRYYTYYDALVSGGRGQFRDVQVTPDGGFIAVGSALGISGVYNQDAWVVKTDGHGCIEPGCHLITGMESQVTNLRRALTVAPNPVASGGNVQVQLSLPPDFETQGALRLIVVSSDWRVVHEERLTPHTSALTLHTSFAPGLYHLHLSDATRWLSGAKLVVD